MTSILRDLAVREGDLGCGTTRYFSLPALEDYGIAEVSRLPVSLRVVLESVLRTCDDERITDDHIRQLAGWAPQAERTTEIPFTVGRTVLNCAAGIPLLGDLTAMREAVTDLGFPPETLQPKVPIDMALDHTLTVDFFGTHEALRQNMRLDVERNRERFEFVKWAMQAYDGIRLFPPGSGILHQLNLEFLAPGYIDRDGVSYFDTLVGTDSHTCMISALGTVGWGVGGIEAGAAVLGQPLFFLTPDVVGVHVTGRLRDGVTATDLVLHVTEMLRTAKVVGKFVEFFGEGLIHLTIPDRATIANMAPEYGATIGYFPVDEQTCRYLRQTGRAEERVRATEAYFRLQGCFGAPVEGSINYSSIVELDLTRITPSVAGPKRPQDRIALEALSRRFTELLHAPIDEDGYGRPASPTAKAVPDDRSPAHRLRDGDIVIASITSCTNTSNPGVMLAAGLVARKAVERGLNRATWVKTSLTPGSRVVSTYLEASDLQTDLDRLGFTVAGYGCGTCVGASGPIDPTLEQQINDEGLVACAVLSGNRNFEARIHPAVRAAFLASPPLVVIFAIAGRIDIDLETEPLGYDTQGEPVYLRDLWPGPEELNEALAKAANPEFYQREYSRDFGTQNEAWNAIPAMQGMLFPWKPGSSYIKEPPFLAEEFRTSVLHELHDARPLVILGDSVTTDHISPIGSIGPKTPAGLYLKGLDIPQAKFNNFGARRMNHEAMIRGGFSNVRLRNAIVPDKEGGYTKHSPDGTVTTIYEAAMRYAEEKVPLIVVAGEEYGTGSARDWAAKVTRLLGVRAVIARSFERIHRSNLVGMGVLPCQLPADIDVASLGLTGEENFDLLGLDDAVVPRQELTLRIRRADGSAQTLPVILRLDTAAEVDYARHGGIMAFILKKSVSEAAQRAV